MTHQQRFEFLQARWRKCHEAAQEMFYQLKYKYGEAWQAPSGKRDRLDSLRNRESAAADAIFTWLDGNSPRQWRTGVPSQWVCDSLSYADATTVGRLSVVPPPAYGSLPMDSLRFAQPVAA